MLFFSKKKQKKENLEKDKQSFVNVVKLLTDSIYKIDDKIQKMLSHGDCHRDSIAFIFRSVQDMISAIELYRQNRFTHVDDAAKLEEISKELKGLIEELETNGNKLSILVENFELTKDGMDEIRDSEMEINEETINHVQGSIISMKFAAKQLTLNIHGDLLTLRDQLYALRWIVSQDYITIISGTDIVLLYEYYQAKYKHKLRYELRFDRAEISKLVCNKKEE